VRPFIASAIQHELKLYIFDVTIGGLRGIEIMQFNFALLQDFLKRYFQLLIRLAVINHSPRTADKAFFKMLIFTQP
jgi:hypothetical protein